MVIVGMMVASGERQAEHPQHGLDVFDTAFGRVRRSRIMITYNDLCNLTDKNYLNKKDLGQRPFLMLPDEKAKPPKPLVEHYLFEDTQQPWRIFDEIEDTGVTKVFRQLTPEKDCMASRAQYLYDYHRNRRHVSSGYKAIVDRTVPLQSLEEFVMSIRSGGSGGGAPGVQSGQQLQSVDPSAVEPIPLDYGTASPEPKRAKLSVSPLTAGSLATPTSSQRALAPVLATPSLAIGTPRRCREKSSVPASLGVRPITVGPDSPGNADVDDEKHESVSNCAEPSPGLCFLLGLCCT